MLTDNEINQLTPKTIISMPTQPMATFIRADNSYVYYVNYHGRLAQVYRDYFCQYGKVHNCEPAIT